MKTELIVSSHAVGESSYHIQLTPAYRRAIFAEPMVRELTLAYIVEKLLEKKVVLAGYGFGDDHLHLFVSNVRYVGEIQLVQLIKGYSSYMMRRGHWYMFRDQLWGKKFWTAGHFYRSVGAVTKESMQWYVTEGQKKHWDKYSYEQYCELRNQSRLADFA
jgi:REP element-mobilizing transposase RayT